VLAPETAAKWLEGLIALSDAQPMAQLAVVQIARRTGDRYRDIAETKRSEVLRWLDQTEAPEHYRTLVREGGQLEGEEQEIILGESLPKGLRLL